MLNIFNKLSEKLSPILAKFKKSPTTPDQESKQTRKNAIIIAMSCAASIAFLTISGLQWHSHSQSLSESALNSSSAVLVNIVTDEIFNGKLYVEEEHKEAQPENSVELTATSEQDQNSPLKYRSTPCEEVKSRNTNKIAIVITNLGLNKSNTLSALNLRKEFTLGFTPYSMDLDDWISQATNKGFEALVNLPMQPLDYPVNDPGPLSMLLNLSNNENLSRLSQIMLKSEKVVGFYSDQAEVFSQSKSSFSPIASEIAKGKYMFLYGNTSNVSVMSEICKAVDLECQTNSLVLDQDLDEDAIKKQLLALEGISYAKGFAVGFIRAYPLTINILKSWSDALNPDSIALVPISVTLSTAQQPMFKPIQADGEKTSDSPKKEESKQDQKTIKPAQAQQDSVKKEAIKPIAEEKIEQNSDAKETNEPIQKIDEKKSDDKIVSKKEPVKMQSKEKANKDIKQQKASTKKAQSKDSKPKKKQQTPTKTPVKSEEKEEE